jgi:hypothetical protein
MRCSLLRPPGREPEDGQAAIPGDLVFHAAEASRPYLVHNCFVSSLLLTQVQDCPCRGVLQDPGVGVGVHKEGETGYVAIK